jgi:CUB domain
MKYSAKYVRVCCVFVVIFGLDQQFVLLTFNTLSTEDDYDFVYIFDGIDSTDDQLMVGQLSRHHWNSMPNYLTSQRYMFIRFTSNSNNQFQGFEATYNSTLSGKY